MTITSAQSIALTAGFLITGMRDFCDSNTQEISYEGEGSLLSLWGQGCLELHLFITAYANLIAEKEAWLLEQNGKNFPGIWHYEVTEVLGYRLASWIANHDGYPPTQEWISHNLTELSEAFFAIVPSKA